MTVDRKAESGARGVAGVRGLGRVVSKKVHARHDAGWVRTLNGVLGQGDVTFGVEGVWVGQVDFGGCELLRVDAHGDAKEGEVGGAKRDVLQSGLGVDSLFGVVEESDGREVSDGEGGIGESFFEVEHLLRRKGVRAWNVLTQA